MGAHELSSWFICLVKAQDGTHIERLCRLVEVQDTIGCCLHQLYELLRQESQ